MISSDCLRTIDIKKPTITQLKRVTAFWIYNREPEEVKKWFALYQLYGGKLTIFQLRRFAFKEDKE